jgi:hypothetical protein
MYTYLRQHPEIFASIHKEPHFFGSDLSPLDGMVREEALYLGLFSGAGDRPRAGEASVWYLLSQRAAGEIRAYVPEAKVLIMLRDPSQMAYSLYALYTRSGNEDRPTFEQALAAEAERREGRALPPGVYFPEGLIYTDVVRHAAKVERYLTAFGRDNVHCIVFDDFVRDPAGVYRGTLEFLGVDPAFQPEFDQQRAAQLLRQSYIRQLRHTPAEVQRRMEFQRRKRHQGPPRPPLAEDLAAGLRDLLAADVERLGSLIGRDLSPWTRGEKVPPVQPASQAPAGHSGGDAPASRG